jgi:hypothetical protein
MLMFALFATAFAVSGSACDPVHGWDAGREGKPGNAACGADAYREAHRLGEALHQLKQEHAAIESRLATLTAAEQGAQRRRQRQIMIDLEAIRGVATTHGWPLDIAAEITP